MVFWFPEWYPETETVQINRPFEIYTLVRGRIQTCCQQDSPPQTMAGMMACLLSDLGHVPVAALLAPANKLGLCEIHGCIITLNIRVASGSSSFDWTLAMLPTFISP